MVRESSAAYSLRSRDSIHPEPSENQRSIAHAAFCVAIGFHIALCLLWLTPRNALENLDFWSFTGIAQNLDLSDLETPVNGFYLLGYPFLL
jgi:hypothetical protein